MSHGRLSAAFLIVIVLAAVSGSARAAEPRTAVIEPKQEIPALPEYHQPSFSKYYLDPRPDSIPGLIAELQKEGALDLAHMTAAGFLSQVFRDNPERLDEWAPAIFKLKDSEREYVWLAVWFAGTEPAMKLLRSAAQKETEAVSKTLAVFDEPSRPIVEFAVETGQHLDLFWGAFFATGKPEYIVRIIGCLPWTLKNPQENTMEYAIGRVAEWSLQANARAHPRVLAICKSELEKQSGDTRQLLEKVIREVEKQPGS